MVRSGMGRVGDSCLEATVRNRLADDERIEIMTVNVRVEELQAVLT